MKEYSMEIYTRPTGFFHVRIYWHLYCFKLKMLSHECDKDKDKAIRKAKNSAIKTIRIVNEIKKLKPKEVCEPLYPTANA